MILYVPETGVPHVNCTFAGVTLGFTGANLAGITVSPISTPGTQPGPTALPLMRSLLYDALSLRDALDGLQLGAVNEELDEAYPPTNINFLIGDGRNEKRAVQAIFGPDAVLCVRYDFARSNFNLYIRGIVLDASSDEGLTALESILRRCVNSPFRFTNLSAIAAVPPMSLDNTNLLNIIYSFTDTSFNVRIGVAKEGQAAWQDHFELAEIQKLLP